MTKTLKITGYVGGDIHHVRSLLQHDPSSYATSAVTHRHGRLVVDAPDSPLDGAIVGFAPVGRPSARLTELTLRLREPFEGEGRSRQFLEAARFVGTTAARLTETVRRAA